MTRDEFWTLVGKVHDTCKGNFDDKVEMLETELGYLPLDEVLAFEDHFGHCMIQSYTWPLWGAAYVINGGCSDDSFMDFRAELISLGRERFEGVLADPETLIAMPWFNGCEGYQYVPRQVWEGRSGKDFPKTTREYPSGPSGEEWGEENLAKLFPKLAKLHKFE